MTGIFHGRLSSTVRLAHPLYAMVTMKRLLILLAIAFPWFANAQALQDINYSYLYNPNSPFSFSLRAVQMNTEWRIFYDLTVRTAATSPQRYSIEWSTRTDLDDKQGVLLATDSTNLTNHVDDQSTYGRLSLPINNSPRIVVAKVLDSEAKQVWFYYELLRPNYPVNGYLTFDEGRPLVKSYHLTEQPFQLHSAEEGQLIVSYYDHTFPAAAPSFSEAQAPVSTGLAVDTTYFKSDGDQILFDRPGLYLVQKDTAVAKGFGFRLYNDYPRYQYLENLVDPLIYVCTRQEFERLKKAEDDKKAFDRVILSITGDTERARTFIREYFRRVEWANIHFHSYKAGWKTDRGMTFVVFGIPDEVYRFGDREVWNYNNQLYKVSFDFVRSSTVFDPDNFVLLRNKKYQDTWYSVVDLWRNARF
jgi:GWxTD domain-containing protein